MFTGIVTDVGTIEQVEHRGDLRVRIGTTYDTGTVDLGASIACSGCCLTVVDKGPGWFAVDVSAESVSRTAEGMWTEGRRLNLERALKVGDELGGHIVTGHVDGVGYVSSLRAEGDSTRVEIRLPKDLPQDEDDLYFKTTFGALIAPKGSITLDGVSLTVNEVEDRNGETHFSLNLIPHTQGVTTLGGLAQGQAVNLEIDVLARYLQRMEQYRAK